MYVLTYSNRIAAPVQIFLTWRIYKLSGTKWVFLICVVTLASSAIGIYSTYTIVNASASATVKELIPAGDAWLASGIASDTLIT